MGTICATAVQRSRKEKSFCDATDGDVTDRQSATSTAAPDVTMIIWVLTLLIVVVQTILNVESGIWNEISGPNVWLWLSQLVNYWADLIEFEPIQLWAHLVGVTLSDRNKFWKPKNTKEKKNKRKRNAKWGTKYLIEWEQHNSTLRRTAGVVQFVWIEKVSDTC